MTVAWRARVSCCSYIELGALNERSSVRVTAGTPSLGIRVSCACLLTHVWTRLASATERPTGAELAR